MHECECPKEPDTKRYWPWTKLLSPGTSAEESPQTSWSWFGRSSETSSSKPRANSTPEESSGSPGVGRHFMKWLALLLSGSTAAILAYLYKRKRKDQNVETLDWPKKKINQYRPFYICE